MKNQFKQFFLILVFLFLLSGCTKDGGKLSVVFINTGNSDSIFLNFPDNRKMIIDTGDEDDKAKILDTLRKYHTKKLDYAIITHPHADHIGSFPKIADIYDIDKVYMPKSDIENPLIDNAAIALNKKGEKIIPIKRSLVISNNDIYAEFLSPADDKYSEENDYSGVLYLKYKNTSFLFTGDAEKTVEKEMLAYPLPDIDVLKVGHHGSKTSTIPSFLDALKPEYAVITTGKNSFGHPSKEVLDELSERNIATYRTDKSGDIIMVSDGEKITVK
jgi:competence protein ComEC